jgi:hypothetical protein
MKALVQEMAAFSALALFGTMVLVWLSVLAAPV